MNAVDPIVVLQQEVRRDHVSRYGHRLHGVLLVLRGMSCQQVGRLLGDSARAVQYWVKRFEAHGLSGLSEKERPGRPKRLSQEKIVALGAALKQNPRDFGFNTDDWDAKALASYLHQSYNIELGLRQCQRLLNQLGMVSRRSRSLASRRPAINYDQSLI